MIALDAVTPLSQIPQKPKKVIRMQTGGDAVEKLAEGPPEDINMLPRFEGFEAGPNQFMLQEEETVIPSEPNVMEPDLFQRGEMRPYAVPKTDTPMSSEPFFDTDMGTIRPEVDMERRMMFGPVIDPREVYPMDPDPGIMGLRPNSNMQMSDMPQLLQANLQNIGNNGIFDLLGKLDNEKPVGSYNI
tara:strand:- start:202 stop:762 length:561 start_codon:yes stop_codon:yes gene_type:complete